MEITAEISIFMFLVGVDVLDSSTFASSLEIRVGSKGNVDGVAWCSVKVGSRKNGRNKGHSVGFSML